MGLMRFYCLFFLFLLFGYTALAQDKYEKEERIQKEVW